MKICFVYQSNYPWDIRVQKIASSLKFYGHSVFIVSSNELGKDRVEITDEALVIRPPAVVKGESIINEVVNFPVFFNPLWVTTINKVVREKEIDLIIVRDLPLALAATRVGRKNKIPVIMDMAECYPELLRSIWQFGAGGVMKYFTHNPRLGDMIEKRAIKELDHIFAMIEESEERLAGLGCDRDKISIVSNTPPISKFSNDALVDRHSNDDVIKILYTGWVNKGRGVDKAIEGVVEFVNNNDRKIQLDIYGSGDAFGICESLISAHNLEGFVTLHGWKSHDEIVQKISVSHIGLVSHRYCTHWNNTIPNKLFDYMASGLSIITSNVPPVARIVNEEECGSVYVDDDAQSFAKALSSMIDRDKRTEMANNGALAVARRYHWEYDEKAMIKAIDKLTSR